MNLTLRKEIINHTFKTFGLFNDIQNINMFEKLNTEKFLIDKKIVFSTENQEFKRKIWAATSKIENSNINIVIADIAEDIAEFTIIIQLDNFFPYALRLSLDPEDSGSIHILVDNKTWVEASTMLQAKMLVGIESLSEIFLQWTRLDKYNDMYQILLNFLNFNEEE